MVYHEQRKINGKIQNYLVSNKRKGNSWEKKSKFVGYGKLSKEKINGLKKEFEKKILTDKKSKYLTKEQLSIIENLRENYFKKINSLNKEEFEKFEESFFTELTYDSNAIEGSSLSLEETNLVLNEGVVPEGKTIREIYEAKNHKKAIEFIKDYNNNLNELFILKLHSIILKNISDRIAGNYRKTNVRIFGSNVKLPQADKVPQLIGNLIYWFNKNKANYHPFELAVLFSMKFVTIHPFIDGNGRVSRLLMNFILKKSKYPWINIYRKNRQKYLNAVRKANDENYTLIFPFLIETLEKNMESFGILKE